MLSSRSPNRVEEATFENLQNTQSEPVRKATPRLKQATHAIIENVMVKITELLETSIGIGGMNEYLQLERMKCWFF